MSSSYNAKEKMIIQSYKCLSLVIGNHGNEVNGLWLETKEFYVA